MCISFCKIVNCVIMGDRYLIESFVGDGLLYLLDDVELF